jgi:hypothetical protein
VSSLLGGGPVDPRGGRQCRRHRRPADESLRRRGVGGVEVPPRRLRTTTVPPPVLCARRSEARETPGLERTRPSRLRESHFCIVARAATTALLLLSQGRWCNPGSRADGRGGPQHRPAAGRGRPWAERIRSAVAVMFGCRRERTKRAKTDGSTVRRAIGARDAERVGHWRAMHEVAVKGVRDAAGCPGSGEDRALRSRVCTDAGPPRDGYRL